MGQNNEEPINLGLWNRDRIPGLGNGVEKVES
jgi:hypothetical protein